MYQRLNTVRDFLLIVGISSSFANTPALAQSRGSNFISEINGYAEINGNQAYVGDFVRRSDILQVLRGEVGVVCNNENRERRFPSGTHTIGDYCTEVPPLSSRRRRPPRDFDSRLPHVISPRNTSLLGVIQPIIRWNPVEGTQAYTVVLFTESSANPIWTTQVSGTEVRYDGPTLRRDTRYRLEVRTDSGLDSQEDSSVGFTLLSVSESERVAASVEALKAMHLNSDSEALGLALIYLGYEHEDPTKDTDSPLHQAALEVLQSRIDSSTDNSLIYSLQGDVYLSVGLPLRAQDLYQQALTLAIDMGQIQGQADSWDGLALLAQSRGELSTAIAHTEQALALYDTMGDLEQLEDLEERLDFLRSQL